MSLKSSAERAFTLLEIMVAATITSLMAVGVYAFLGTGLILFAKNSAINIAHQQARIGVLQIEQDIHSAISLPQLVDANRGAVSGSGPAAGISFQLFGGGPFRVSAAATAGQRNVSLQTGTFTPVAGQRLCIPTHQIELDISSVGGASGGVRTLTLASNLPRAVAVTLNDAGIQRPVDVTGFITDRVAYVVTNGELRYFGRRTNQNFTVMANSVTSPTPFSTPQTPAGAPYYRFVAAINLTTADPATSNRGFKAANMFINSQVPTRARLCNYQ